MVSHIGPSIDNPNSKAYNYDHELRYRLFPIGHDILVHKHANAKDIIRLRLESDLIPSDRIKRAVHDADGLFVYANGLEG